MTDISTVIHTQSIRFQAAVCPLLQIQSCFQKATQMITVTNLQLGCNDYVCFRSTLKDGAIRRRLQLKNVTSEDFKSSFTCVVMNTAGMDQRHIKLVATSGGSHGGKKRKHSVSIL